MLPGSDTWNFIRREWRFLLFGLLFTFWSSPGQTFVISIFGSHLRHDFNLSHGEFGGLYTLATLASAALLWKAGPLVDKFPLKKFANKTVLAMVVVTALFSMTQGPVTLLIGIFGLRFLGQGMLNHIGITAMSRRYEKERGRALAIVGLGFPLSEVIVPPLVVLGLGMYDWRILWLIMGGLIGLVVIPLVPILIRHTENQDGTGTSELLELDKDAKHWTRAEMLRDPRFYMVAITAVAQSGIVTGLFFHQVHIIGLKGWSLEWWSICFSIFALSGIVGSLISGFIIDRFSARRLVPFVLLPLVAAILLFGTVDHWIFAAIIMAALGIGAGLAHPALSALWPELYGTQHLGAIRSVATVVMVFGSALGPIFMGTAFDASASFSSITGLSAALAALSAALAWVALQRP